MTQSDMDATTAPYLRNKYAIVGVGETSYRRGSQESTRNLATWAINNALDDAGLEASDVDGMLSYSGNDSTFSTFVAGDLGIRLNFYMDVHGGGSSSGALNRSHPWSSKTCASCAVTLTIRVLADPTASVSTPMITTKEDVAR